MIDMEDKIYNDAHFEYLVHDIGIQPTKHGNGSAVLALREYCAKMAENTDMTLNDMRFVINVFYDGYKRCASDFFLDIHRRTCVEAKVEGVLPPPVKE